MSVKILGYKEKKKIKALEERVLRWILEMEGGKLGYLAREELRMNKIREKRGRRAWKFEERLGEGKRKDSKEMLGGNCCV
ncbi:hypothetical protein X777_01113 [Ooceraea biroi]|uniref:Uncharacterized protein n=1 Tax=Ooceraea biroi TaxID=2015173 RepID=A0A026WR21_OOCBI|nr:hypothetical protein X777_01113 [Ooceraea biroi]